MALECNHCRTELIKIEICRNAVTCPRLLCPHCFSMYEPQYTGRTSPIIGVIGIGNMQYARYETLYESFWKIWALNATTAKTWA